MNDFAPQPASPSPPQHDAALERIAATRAQLSALDATVRRGTEKALGAAARYAGRHPWQLAGAGVAIGVALVLLLRRSKD